MIAISGSRYSAEPAMLAYAASGRSSMDRASDYGSEGYGFDSCRPRTVERPATRENLERAFVLCQDNLGILLTGLLTPGSWPLIDWAKMSAAERFRLEGCRWP